MSELHSNDFFSIPPIVSNYNSSGAGIIPDSIQRETANDSSAWSIPMLCIGIAIIACCVLLPAADENHRLIVENANLQANVTQIKKQIDINDQFLKSVADNPTLLERLAERQMKLVRNGESVLKMKDASAPGAQMSPFLLLNLPPPTMAVAGSSEKFRLFNVLTQQPRVRLFAMGGALLLMATSLVLGAAGRPSHDE